LTSPLTSVMKGVVTQMPYKFSYTCQILVTHFVFNWFICGVKPPGAGLGQTFMHKRLVSQALMAWVCCLLASCATVEQQLLQTAGNALALQGGDSEDDLEIAQHASAFYIKLSESMLSAAPSHVPLALSTTATLTQYAYAFVSTPADQLESQNAKEAYVLRKRAARLYTRAKSHGLKALELHQPGLIAALGAQTSHLTPALNELPPLTLKPELTGLAYWSAASWAGAISLSKDSPEVVADLPQAMALASLAYAAQPQYGDGALASLMGTLEMAKAGGNKKKALDYFDLALTITHRNDPGALVSKAENYALAVSNPELFESLLKEALACTPAKNDVATQVMQTRARWLLEHLEDYF